MCVKIQNSKFKNSAKSFSTYIRIHHRSTEADVVVVVVYIFFIHVRSKYEVSNSDEVSNKLEVSSPFRRLKRTKKYSFFDPTQSLSLSLSLSLCVQCV